MAKMKYYDESTGQWIALDAKNAEAISDGSNLITPQDVIAIDSKVDNHMNDSNIHFTSTERTKLSGISDNANNYILPNATTSVVGGVKVGTNLTVTSGTLSVANASTTVKGVVQLNDTLTSTSTTLAATANQAKALKDLVDAKASSTDLTSLNNTVNTHTSKKASTTELGHVMVDGTSITVDSNGKIGANIPNVEDSLTSTSPTSALSANQGKVISDKIDILTGDVNTHKSKIASTTELGHIKVDGATITIDANGVIRSSGGANIPDASTSQKGIVQLNDSITSTSNVQAATANAVKQVNSKLTHPSVILGMNTVATMDTFNLPTVIIGNNVKAGGYSVAIGSDSESASNAVAIGRNSKALNSNEGTLGVNTSTVGARDWKVPGTFSVSGTKNFEIPHPAPHKKDTHVIRHGVVESPTAGDTLYRYTIEATEDGQTVELQLPDYFEHLNTNVDVWVNGDGHFGRAFGKVEGDMLYVTCELSGSYKALVIGTRNDDHDSVQSWKIKGVEREVGESWVGETYVFEDEEIIAEEEYLTEVVA